MLAEHGLTVAAGVLAAGRGQGRRPRDHDHPGQRGPATWPRSPRPCAATTTQTEQQVAAVRKRAARWRPRRAASWPRLDAADRRAGRRCSPTGRAPTSDGDDRQSCSSGCRDAGRGLPRGRARRARSATRSCTPSCGATRCPATGSRGSRCRATTESRRAAVASCAARTCRATSPSPRACSRSSARARTRRGCSPARATRSAPTAGSSCCPADSEAKRLSTAFDSVTLYGHDPDTRARTSTARSARRASRSRRSRT